MDLILGTISRPVPLPFSYNCLMMQQKRNRISIYYVSSFAALDSLNLVCFHVDAKPFMGDSGSREQHVLRHCAFVSVADLY